MKKALEGLAVLVLGCLIVLALAGFFSPSVSNTYVVQAAAPCVGAAGQPGGPDDFDAVDAFVTGGAEQPGVNNGDCEPVVPAGVAVDVSDDPGGG